MPALSLEQQSSLQHPLSTRSPNSNSNSSSFDLPTRKSNDKTISGVFAYTNGTDVETGLPDHRLEQIKSLRNGSQNSLTNGSAAVRPANPRSPSTTGSNASVLAKGTKTAEYSNRISASPETLPTLGNVDKISEIPRINGSAPLPLQTTNISRSNSTHTRESHYDSHDDASTRSDVRTSTRSTHLSSQYPAMTPINSVEETQHEPIKAPDSRQPARHTLNIPHSSSGAIRASRDFSYTSGPSEEVLAATGRASPTRDNESHVSRRRRASLGLVRRSTRANSDAHLEEVPPDADAERWTQAIKEKRASRRKRLEEDDDRVIVGKKVEEGHVNWVTAYNMLTGIRFTVSRTNAKMDRELTDADFDAKHKFSFDVTGSELTPSAKYDFKFKDYSPWVFRHLRQNFGLDPADYLMSLTSKYILSELGSPGKSGSFFYFSRDYKYIIKTIHHAEHKLLRKVLREYYNHVKSNPNTLISQFYGLHRVKIAYGRKIHFVVMNNLFPPHRDIHSTFDLKGSTVGRELDEQRLQKNPRAVLKDLNWLRRGNHLEFDQKLREKFIEQLQKDVALLQKLQIMDYSLLVGVHEMEKGNDDNVREKTLKVFQPGGEKDEEDLLPGHLMRTPSRLESAKKARELRETLKKEKPTPMGLSTAKMPDQLAADDERHNRIFYSEDGGIRATHEDGRPGEVLYYLGVIDCLTHYGFVKRAEHFWKGLSNDRHQISPIPPKPYGERFLNFMTGITMTKEEAARRAEHDNDNPTEEVHAHNVMHHHHVPEANPPPTVDGNLEIPRSPRNEFEVEHTMNAAEKSTDKQTDSEKGRRRSEEEKPQRTLLTDSPTDVREHRMSTTLPIVQEARETSSHNSSRNSRSSGLEEQLRQQAAQAEQTRPQNENAGQVVEYTVTSEDDHHLFRRHHSDRDQTEVHQSMKAPLDAQVVDDEPILSETSQSQGSDSTQPATPEKPEKSDEPPKIHRCSPKQRISKPPRIDSGIIPKLDAEPLVRPDEIGIAK